MKYLVHLKNIESPVKTILKYMYVYNWFVNKQNFSSFVEINIIFAVDFVFNLIDEFPLFSES